MERIEGAGPGVDNAMLRGLRAMRGRWRALLLVAVLVCVSLYCARLLAGVEGTLMSLYSRWGALVLMIALIAFIVLLAVPCLPGVELGWALMMIAAPRGTLLVYGAALLALSLSFAVGRRIPLPAVTGLLRWLGLHHSAGWVASLMAQSPQDQLNHLLQAAPPRWAPFLLRHRYLTLAILLNLPGNTLVGGGGGIALLAGLSRLFTYPLFLATIALAAAPLPLLVLANVHIATWLFE